MFLICFFACLFIIYPLIAVIKGSETAVSVESSFTFSAADNNNTMLGFGWFKNGFTLEDSLTTCTFDSVYPVSGGVDLNGGNLYVMQNLTFGSLIYNNVTADIWNMLGNRSILYILQGAKIKLNKPLDIGEGALYLENGSILERVMSSKLTGRVHGVGAFTILG